MQNSGSTSREGPRGTNIRGRGYASGRGGSSRNVRNQDHCDSTEKDDIGEGLNPMSLLRANATEEELPTKDEFQGIDRPSFWRRNAVIGERIKRLKYFSVVYHTTDNEPGSYWYIINAKTLPTIPLQSWEAAIPPQDPAWFDTREPWAGFYPRHGHHQGAVINRVNLPNAAIPGAIESRGRYQYCLKEEVARPWYELEVLLVELSLFLTRNDALAHLPKFPFIPYPSDYGYLKLFTSDYEAAAAVRQSRNAFVRLTTFISFLLSFWRFPLTGSNGLAAFECYIERHWKVHSNTTRYLVKDSIVGSFNVMKRAGFFLDLAGEDNPWLPYLHIFAEAGLPIYIHAGTDPTSMLRSRQNSHLLPLFEAWTPSPLLFEDAINRHSRGQPAVFAVVEGSPLKPYHNLAHLEDNSLMSLVDFGYESGMSPADFKQRRLAAIAEWRNNPILTSHAVQEKERRGTHASWTSEVHHSMEMFIWIQDGHAWSRRRLSHSIKQFYFDLFVPSQRLYTPFDHSMDLCWIWDRSSGDPLAIEDDQSTMEVMVVAPAATAHESPSFAHNICEVDSDSDGDGGEDDNDDSDDEVGPPVPLPLRKRPPPSLPASEPSLPPSTPSPPLAPGVEELRRILRIRLGYNMLVELPNRNREVVLGEEKGAPWGTKDRHKYSLKVLGLPESLSDTLDEREKMAIADVAATLTASKRSTDRIHLASRWDIGPAQASPVQMPPMIAYIRITYFDEIRYAIFKADKPVSEQWWVLVVSPSALLELCRAKTAGILDMARYLMARGIPFAKARPVVRSYIPPTPSPLVHDGIYYLSQGDTIPSYVFQRYERERDAFLRSPRGAMALKEGGFIWRLAKDHISPKQIRDWMGRPTHLTHYRISRDERRQSQAGVAETLAFYEDSLTSSEIGLILGTCHEQSEHLKDPTIVYDKIVYFWPTTNAWRASGLNTNGWSELAEAWFAERLKLLQTGRAQAFTSSMWRTKLQQLKNANKAWNNYNRMAAVVVDANASPMV